MYIAIFAKVQINGHTHGEEMLDIGVKQGCPVPLSYSACALMKLKHIWMRSMGILCVCLLEWVTFFFVLMMLFYSLIPTKIIDSYMSFALLLALKPIY